MKLLLHGLPCHLTQWMRSTGGAAWPFADKRSTSGTMISALVKGGKILAALHPAGEAPDSGALATGPDGALLLLLHSKAAQKATAVQLPADPLGEESAQVSLLGTPTWHRDVVLMMRAGAVQTIYSFWLLQPWAVPVPINSQLLPCLHLLAALQICMTDLINRGGIHN